MKTPRPGTYVIWQCLNPESIFSTTAEQITCDVIYNSTDYHCDQGNKNKSQDLGELGFIWAFIKFPPASLTGCKLWRIFSVWLESPSVTSLKIRGFIWKLTSSYCPHCEGSCTDADTPLWHVFSPSIRLHVTAADDSKFIFCQFWRNAFSKLFIYTLHLFYFCMKIRLLMSFELLLLFVHCEMQRVLLSLTHRRNAHSAFQVANSNVD